MHALSAPALSQLIAAIYRSAMEGDDFVRFFQDLQSHLACHALFVAELDGAQNAYRQTWLYGDLNARGLRAFADYETDIYRRDPMIAALSKGDLVPVAHSIAVIGRDHYLDQDYVKWSADELGSSYWTLFHGASLNATTFGFSVQCTKAMGALSATLVSQLELLFGQIESARLLATAHRQDVSRDRPTIHLTLDGMLVSMNGAARALLDEEDVCHIVGRQFVIVGDDRLAFVLGRLRMSPPTGWISWTVRNDRSDLIVRARFGYPSSNLPAHVVLCIEDRQRTRALCAAYWKNSYGLTAAEANLAFVLAKQAATLRQAAQIVGVSHNTARTHFANIFRKTGCATQTELMRTLFDL